MMILDVLQNATSLRAPRVQGDMGSRAGNDTLVEGEEDFCDTLPDEGNQTEDQVNILQTPPDPPIGRPNPTLLSPDVSLAPNSAALRVPDDTMPPDPQGPAVPMPLSDVGNPARIQVMTAEIAAPVPSAPSSATASADAPDAAAPVVGLMPSDPPTEGFAAPPLAVMPHVPTDAVTAEITAKAGIVPPGTAASSPMPMVTSGTETILRALPAPPALPAERDEIPIDTEDALSEPIGHAQSPAVPARADNADDWVTGTKTNAAVVLSAATTTQGVITLPPGTVAMDDPPLQNGLQTDATTGGTDRPSHEAGLDRDPDPTASPPDPGKRVATEGAEMAGPGDETLARNLAVQAEQTIRSVTSGDAAGALRAHPAPTPQIFAPAPLPAASVSVTPAGIEVLLPVEDMGALRMEFMQSGDRLHVAVAAERPELLDLLRRNADLLATELRQSGFAGTDISFGRWAGGRQDGTSAPVESHADMGAEPVPVTAPAGPAVFTRPLPGLTGQLNLRM